jgi:diaminopimelate epimerase
MNHEAIKFRKMNGLGNDFVIVDGRKYNLRLNNSAMAAIGDRKHGIGCDQIIILQPAENADVTMRIFNRDGGEVESCGNASRCVADLIFTETNKENVTIDTRGGFLSCQRAEQGFVTVDMGVPHFDWRDIPLAEPVADTARVPIGLNGLAEPCCVNVGNPHAIFWVDVIEDINLTDLGPKLENHPIFPQKANISLAKIISPDHMQLKVWERGVGLTKACGTAACAAAVAGARTGKTMRDVKVSLPGGDLFIRWDQNDHILMTGAVTYEFDGELPQNIADLLAP